MLEESDPPRKFFQLKPKEFEAVNAVPPRLEPPPGTPAAAPGPGRIDAARSEPTPGPIDVRDLFRAAGEPGKILARHPKTAAENEVHAILRDNHARADAAGMNVVAEKLPRASRRKRDFWLLLVGGNACVAVAALINPIFGVAGAIFFNGTLIWVMWFVMGDY